MNPTGASTSRAASRIRPHLLAATALGLLVGMAWYWYGSARALDRYARDQVAAAADHVAAVNTVLSRMAGEAATLEGVARELASADSATIRAGLVGAAARGILAIRDTRSGTTVGEPVAGPELASLPLEGGTVAFIAGGNEWRLESRTDRGQVRVQFALRAIGAPTPQRTLHQSRLAATLLLTGDSVLVVDRQTLLDGIPEAGTMLPLEGIPPAIRPAFEGDTVMVVRGTGLFDHQPSVVAAVPAGSPALIHVLQRRTAEITGAGSPAAPLLREAAAGGTAAALLVILIGMLAQVRTLARERDILATRHAFVTTVSHELRTPLAQIGAFAELLNDRTLETEEDRRRAIETILHETRRLELLVENVLSIGRPPAGPPAAESRLSADGPLEIDSVLAAFAPIAARAGVTIRPDMAAGTVVGIAPHALRQMVLNLLDNAVKYGPRGQTVSIGMRRIGNTVRLEVTDQGPGIDLDAADLLWEPFVRGPGSGGTPGSGLGLAVVRQLVAAAGGTVAISAGPDGGCTVSVDLRAAGGEE